MTSPFFDIIEPFQADSALKTTGHFAHIIFEPFQAVDLSFKDHHIISEHACFTIPRDFPSVT